MGQIGLRLVQLAAGMEHPLSASRSPLIIALIIPVLLSIPVVALLFNFVKKRKRIVWYAAASGLLAVFASIALVTNHLYWWIPAYICGTVGSIIVFGTLFQAGHESCVKSRMSQQNPCASGLTTRKLKGRTTREFESEENVWDVLDHWAEARKYKLMKQSKDSRTYRRRGPRTFTHVPKVQVTSTDSGYKLDAWLVLRVYFRVICFQWFFPLEVVIDSHSYWLGWGDWHPMDIRHIASEDVNALIQMLGA